MIVENEAYNNPFNYQFVTNVFNPLFGQMPSRMQNIELDHCQPICIPDDAARIAKENRAEIKRIESKLDLFLPSIIDIESKLDLFLPSIIDLLTP